MALSDLFRREAVNHQRARLWGDVILTQPLSYFVIVAVFALILIAAGLFLTSQNYARKESVAGYLMPDAGVVRVFADQGGVLDQLLVTDGQKVTKGEPLARVKLERLSSAGVSSQQEILASVTRELTAITARLEETNLQLLHERNKLAERLNGLRSEEAALNEEEAILKARIALAEKQYQAATDLAENGYAAERLVDERQAAVLVAKQAHSTIKRQIIATQNSIMETASTLEGLSFQFEEQRAGLRSRKETLLQQQSNLQQVRGYTLTASVDGTISGILASEGKTLRPALPLMAIRPIGTELKGQLLVPSRAIGLIEVGQRAKIQFDAFPYQRFGVFTSTVTSVSESILTPTDLPTSIPMQEAFYLVGLELDNQAVEVKGKPVPLKTGMSLKADITLENRTLIEWMLDPIYAVTGKL